MHIHDLTHIDRFRAILADLSYSCAGNDGTSSHDRVMHTIDEYRTTFPEFKHELDNLQIIDSNVDNVLFKSGDTCYLSSRGTDLDLGQHTFFRDAYNDILIASGNTPHRSETTELFLQKNMNLHPEISHWEAVGHSAGGRYVEDLGEKHPEVKVTSFEAGRSMLEKSTPDHDNITSHKIVGDPICLGDSPGHTIFHNVDYGSNLMKSHSLSNYLY